MTDDRPLKKDEFEEGASGRAPSFSFEGAPRSLSMAFHAVLAWFVSQTPGMIVWVILMALMWGVGARIAYEVFMWGWDLFGWGS